MKSQKKQTTSMTDLINAYKHSSKWFDESLGDRSMEEITYDKNSQLHLITNRIK